MATCGGTGCGNKTATEQDGSVLCLAVVRENGADVVLFDATGTPRSFTYTGDPRKLCFSTHGNGHVDDLLTPCFDEDGIHGVPDESCFCGVDTPHLHAHFHDPTTCHDQKKTSNAQSESDLARLAQLTLHPNDGEMHLGASDQLPSHCNSQEIARSMTERGLSEQQHARGRRISQIQHDDHVDYLVHNETTGDLHLEHPCDACGDNDVHGKFQLVGKRNLSQGSDIIRLHFFEVAHKPFHVLDHIMGIFEFDIDGADRVLAARPAHERDNDYKQTPTKKKPCCRADGICESLATSLVETEFTTDDSVAKTVRSIFLCKQICCASEIPMLNTVLDNVNGVQKVLINVPIKLVSVDHDADVVSAQEIEALLNKNHFGATVQSDGGASLAKGVSTVGRSQFHVQKICCASEIPAITGIVEPLPSVTKVSINVTTKMVYVDHDTATLSAVEISNALNADHFGASIRHDAADDVSVPLSAFVRSTLSFEASKDDAPNVTTLKTFLESFDASQMESFVVDVPSKKIKVVHNPHVLSANTIVELLANDTGIQTRLVVNGAESANWDFPQIQAHEEEIITEKVSRPSTQTILSGVFWVISMLSLIGGNWEYLKYVAVLSVAFGLPSIAIKAFRTLRRCQFDTNVLMFIAAVGALALQEFTEAAAVTFLFSISEYLELRATSRARNALSEIVRLRPDKANLIHPFTKQVMVIPASAVPAGALVSVRPGDKIPCDGVVIEGKSTVDESSLTGESRPVRKGPKDAVSGGTINSGNAELVVRTTSTSENSAVAKLIRLVEEAQANRSPTEKLVDEFAKRYTPLVIFAAILMCSIPWAFGRDIGRQWTHNGLVLIVVACPCALIISTPVTYVAGLAATAQRGVLIKGGVHLEALGKVRKIAFDKTGTLTQGKFALIHLEMFSSDYSREEALQYLTVMEERASHPLAQAIVQAAQNESVSVPKGMIAKNHTQLAGEGVTAVVNDKAVHVGNERLFRRLDLFDGLALEQKQAAQDWASIGGTVGFMSIAGSDIVCAYSVADAVRPEARDVVETLKNKFGIDVTMLTGDNHDAAIVIGSQVGLDDDHIKSQLLPKDKLTLVADLKEDHRPHNRIVYNPCRGRQLVLMCGDGVNDAPALAVADVGVSMGEGAALAMETSDVTLLDSQLDKLVFCIRMGHRVNWKIRENVIFSLAVKAIVVGFALAGSAQLWAAIASDVGAMLIVTLNGMTLLPSRKKRHKPANETLASDEEAMEESPLCVGGDGTVAQNAPLLATSSVEGNSNHTKVEQNRSIETISCCAQGECNSHKATSQSCCERHGTLAEKTPVRRTSCCSGHGDCEKSQDLSRH